MLAQLDDIDWEGLEHAFGAADDVPDLLRDLAGTDAESRAEAMMELHANIWHQGTVYEATAYAVPFLIELLEADLEIEKIEILLFLSLLAKGTSYHEVHQGLLPPAERPAALEQELSWVAATKAAVGAGIAAYEPFLADASPTVRAAAAHLLGNAVGAPERQLSRLAETFRAPDSTELVRLAATLAIGSIEPRSAAAEEFLVEVAAGAADLSCRVGAALGLAIHGRAMPPAAKDLLIEAFIAPGALEPLFKQLPWDDLDLRDFIATTLQEAPEAAEELVSRSIRMIETLDASEAGMISWPLLYLAFGATSRRFDSVAELSPLQIQAIDAIARSDAFWAGRNNGIALSSFGLPSKRQELQLFLGIEPDRAPEIADRRPWWKFW